MRRKLPDARTLLALLFALVAVGSVVNLYVAWHNSQIALKDARAALANGRATRKLTDYKFCKAINRGIAINNRDRATFIHSRRQTEEAIKTVADPVLRSLLRQSLVQTARELKVRPKLTPLPCVSVIQHPRGPVPKVLTTNTPTTAQPDTSTTG